MQTQKQTLVQQQRLSLSPQLVQSIKLMAMPFADLRDRILEEAEKNPAIEIVSDPLDASEWAASEGGKTAMSRVSASDWSESADWVETASESGEGESDDHQDFIEGALHRDETLQEHLLEGLAEISLPEDVRTLAALVIQNLDRDGFHIVPPEELEGSAPEVLHSALAAVRALEPVGCACSGFQESLAVQARLLSRGPLEQDPLLLKTVCILEKHFDLLEKGRPEALLKALSKLSPADVALDLDEAEGVFGIIRSLDPFPGRSFDTTPQSWVVPDVIVRRTDGDFSVIINDEEIPVVGISPFFMELEGPVPKEARDFARESVKEAQWFIHTIERRNRTILKLARALVVFQRDFFIHGPCRLAPLRMKDIAEEIGMHEATVSRAANGKYLQCEWGLFELRYFFSNQVGSTRTPAPSAPGEAWSSGLYSKQGVKEMIRQIIAESKENLSDQKLSDLLAVRGIKVARRTVAKYRGELTIGSSFDR